MTTDTTPAPAAESGTAVRQTVTVYVTQTTPVVLGVDAIDLDAPGARSAVERALRCWLSAGGPDRGTADELANGLQVHPGDGKDLPLALPVVALPAGRRSGAGMVVTWERRTCSDSAALDELSTYLRVDEDGEARESWPGGADALDALAEVLTSTGRPV